MTPQKKNTNEVLHKLDFIDDDKDDIVLIAIKSNMPDYKMAYSLNRYLGVQFKKVLPEISLTENVTAFFRSFIFQDHKNHLIWRLFENKSNYTENDTDEGYSLFKNNEELFAATHYLIPEWKNIDFFILIENTDFLFETEELLEKLQNIKNISTQFIVDIDSLNIKSQKNLIF
ncbi:MAG: IPExxxVDY family protein [Myroides sp.]